jgi:3-oxoacyl-[acyl-carrier protein] reductase
MARLTAPRASNLILPRMASLDADPPPPALAPAPGSRIAILGGCGGIGRAVVSACLGAEAEVAVLDLPRSLAAFPPPARVRSFGLDATDEASVAAAFAALDAAWGALDGYVGLAGFMTRRTPVAETAPEAWDELVDGNLRSAFLCARAALPLLLRGRDPSLVLVSSGLATRVAPGYGGYAASKAGLLALAKAIAAENAPRLRANCVAPGAVDTEFLTGGTGREARRASIDREAYLRTVPMGRLALPGDVAGPILFLLGPASCYMTGQVLYVNGGGLTP